VDSGMGPSSIHACLLAYTHTEQEIENTEKNEKKMLYRGWVEESFHEDVTVKELTACISNAVEGDCCIYSRKKIKKSRAICDQHTF